MASGRTAGIDVDRYRRILLAAVRWEAFAAGRGPKPSVPEVTTEEGLELVAAARAHPLEFAQIPAGLEGEDLRCFQQSVAGKVFASGMAAIKKLGG